MVNDEITALLERITETFSRLDLPAWFECFHQPHVMVTKHANYSPKTIAECREIMGASFDKLHQQGFCKSTLDYHKIKLLAETTAVVSAVWSRWTNTDELLQTFGATYVLSKVEDKWGISLLTTHKAENILLE